MDTQTILPLGDPALTTKQAAHYLGVSPSLLNRLLNAGCGPAVHVYNRRRVYRRADLDVFAAAHRIEPVSSNEGDVA